MPLFTSRPVPSLDARARLGRSRILARAAIAVFAVAFAVGMFPAVDATAAHAQSTGTSVMGRNLLKADQLAAWYWGHHGSSAPRIPALHNDVRALAQIYLNESAREGVRGDLAFIQGSLETGWFSFHHSQVPADANNFSGIYAFDNRYSLPNCVHGDASPSRCLPSPAAGVLVQIQLLRSYADPSVRSRAGTMQSAPADRAGMAPVWEDFGGHNCPCGQLIWASQDNYGLNIVRMYQDALAGKGDAPLCPVPRDSDAPKSGSGYFVATQGQGVFADGTARFHGAPAHLQLGAPLIGGDSTKNGYWLLGADGGVFNYGVAHLYGAMAGKQLHTPMVGMTRTVSGHGYWLAAADGGVFAFGDARFYGSLANTRLTSPVLGIERTPSGRGYWLLGADGGVFAFGDARFYGGLAAGQIASIVAMQRTKSGNGYWLRADGGVFAFGDARFHGSALGCAGATRMLATPSGNGYWVATADGCVLPFGDARKFGAPARASGLPVALMPVSSGERP